MALKKIHSTQQTDLSKKTNEMIAQTYIDGGKSREQLWAELEKRIDARQPVKTVMMGSWVKVAMAAAFALLIGIAVFMQLYTKTIVIPAGQQSNITLPDNSLVRINAQS